MPPVRTGSPSRPPSHITRRALTELEVVLEEGSSSSQTLVRRSIGTSTSSGSTRSVTRPGRRTRSLPNKLNRQGVIMSFQSGSVSGRVSRRSDRTERPIRRAQTWSAPGLVSASQDCTPRQGQSPSAATPIDAAPPPPGPTSPSRPADPFNPLSPDSESDASDFAVSTPPLARPAPRRPLPHDRAPTHGGTVLTSVNVAPFVPLEAGDEDEQARRRQHASETERARTRLRLMLDRETAYAAGWREPEDEASEEDKEGEGADSLSRCGIDPAEYQAKAAWLLEVTAPRHADPALRDHLLFCADTRFLAVILFARLVSLTVFVAEEDPTYVDAERREASITHAAMGCLMIASKNNHDFTEPLSPIWLGGFRWLARKDNLGHADLLHLEATTLRTLSYRINPPTPSHLLSELLHALPTLLDAVLHLEPGVWEWTLRPACERSIRMLLVDFDHTRFPLSLLVCLLVWTDVREMMRDELGSVEEAEDRAEEIWAEMRGVVGGHDGWRPERVKEARRWFGKVLGW